MHELTGSKVMVQHSQTSIESEIEFRIRFKKEYGVDYLEALDKLKNRMEESERKWINTLISHGVIK